MKNINNKKSRDVELSSETIIPNILLSSNISKTSPAKPLSNASLIRMTEDSPEDNIEKKT